MREEPINTYIVVLVGPPGTVPDWTKFTGKYFQVTDYVDVRKRHLKIQTVEVLIKEERVLDEYKPREPRGLFETCYEEV